MIRRLRRRHRALTLTLAPVAVLGLGLAIGARVDVPLQERPEREHPNARAETLVEVEGVSWSVPGIDTWVETSELGLWLDLPPDGSRDRAPLRRPDVLVYWSPTRTVEGAQLLGRLPTYPTLQALPPEARRAEGYLLLYSLAHREIVADTPFPAFPE